MCGIKAVIAGGAQPTTKFVALVAVPAAVVTLIGPVTAVAGTVVESSLAEIGVTNADTPPKATALPEGSVLNPLPRSRTVDPAGAHGGDNEVMASADPSPRVIATMLPTSSYWYVAVWPN